MAGLTWVAEIGVEELPARYLPGLTADWGTAVRRALEEARLEAEVTVAASPRRLVAQGTVSPRQTPLTRQVKGPGVEAAYRHGQPTAAYHGFLRRLGVGPEAVRVVDGYLVAEVEAPREPAERVLPEALSAALAALPLPRSMRWGAGEARFLRPIRWALLLLEDQALPWTVAGVRAGRATYGNRTDHPGPLTVASAGAYADALAQGMVMLSQAGREAAIAAGGRRLAEAEGAVMEADPALLTEVAALVEWPTPFLGRFEERYLAVPEPVLVASMKGHQRYFPLRNADGSLYPGFVGVRNGVGEDLELVRRGNEKVLRARLEDAAFFFTADRRRPLADREPELDRVVFHAELGTLGDKLRRLLTLAGRSRAALGLDRQEAVDLGRAVRLAKCDLLTHVVEEFPELQGVMGGIYARMDGEAEAVARALEEQYRPAGPEDAIPDGRVGQALVLLDRLDTLAGAQIRGIRVSGSEDPFGLRRAALAAGRVLVEGDLDPEAAILELAAWAAEGFGVGGPEGREVARAVTAFVQARLEGYLAERGGTDPALVAALLAAPAPWGSYRRRLAWAAEAAASPAWAEVQRIFKRLDRVWDRSGAELPEVPADAPAAEQELAAALAAPRGEADDDLGGWWRWAQVLVPVVDAFFEAVLVNDPDPAVRARRMDLVGAARAALLEPVDWSRL
ncbi:Glycine--tRNA ligase beta subunit [Candidatus Hydrogenisulfobacillus filiaventi]|uniref:Glycine--tRNA ligase beta subunit n=1 Tax=Candidatus Hydrogenisulfobacillus filiaventi TaxID=2707344 RepID=A0A6F8ZIR2_9FIRM|nr:Glycine--tRNA ligase beta subunit [Candidatus Hydrogenisulfobacillus filiaventi]